jgi:uncharacterized protein with HEPN domain
MRRAAESDRLLLAYIGECIERIREYTGGERRRFLDSQLVQDAVARNLQTLAESTQRLSEAIKETEPDVLWREIAGFRNVLTHAYLGLDPEVLWSVVNLRDDKPFPGPPGRALSAGQPIARGRRRPAARRLRL